VKLDKMDQVILTAPCGIEDVINLVVNPTPYFFETEERLRVYHERVRKKKWESIWDKVRVNHVTSENKRMCL
jgi:uncharacterized protein